jgi:hypothetical protein
MRRLAALVLFGLIGLPAAPASACELVVCDPNGPAQDIYYYLLWNQPVPFQLRYTYVDTGTTAGLMFYDGSGPQKRVVHEFRAPVVFVVCAQGRAAFESAMSIVTNAGMQIQGELYEVHSATSGLRVGTLFKDRAGVGVTATGGGISVDVPYACNVGGTVEPVMNKATMFHTAFDTAAIDGATPGTIEREYIGPARERLGNSADAHMTALGCSQITLSDFAAMVQVTEDCKLHYDMGDPTAIVISQPSN